MLHCSRPELMVTEVEKMMICNEVFRSTFATLLLSFLHEALIFIQMNACYLKGILVNEKGIFPSVFIEPLYCFERKQVPQMTVTNIYVVQTTNISHIILLFLVTFQDFNSFRCLSADIFAIQLFLTCIRWIYYLCRVYFIMLCQDYVQFTHLKCVS